ncbi:MAG: oligosaccharide flippase family protein, partial [Patescibacteria group bacterium]
MEKVIKHPMPTNTVLKTSARKNVFYLLTTEGVTKVLSFLVFVIMARSFSASSYGAIALAFSVGSLFYIFFNLGIEHHLVRDIKHFLDTNDMKNIHRLMDSIAILKVWLLPIFSIIFVLIFWLMQWDGIYFVILFFIFLHFYLVSALQLQFFAFRAFEQMRYELVGRVTHAAVLLVFVATIIVLQKSVAAIGAGYVLISLTMLIVITIFFSKKLDYKPRIPLKIGSQEFALVMKTKYLFLTGVCTSIFSGIDIIIISRFQDIAAVGVYKNALMLTLALF